MRLLLIMRAYSHVVPCLISGEWNPMGMPAFSKLLEGLSEEGVATDVLLLCRLPDDRIGEMKELTFSRLPGIRFRVLPFAGWFSHMRQILRQVKSEKYDVVYVDRAHVTFAAVLAWFRHHVVLRLHGVANLFELPFWRKGLVPSVELMSFAAPFSRVICSRDGSPGEHFMKKYLNPDVQRDLLFNGVDSDVHGENGGLVRQEFGIPQNGVVVSTVGRLEESKSTDVFVDALLELVSEYDQVYGIVVGGGALQDKLQKEIEKRKAEKRIFLTGQVPHEKIGQLLAATDVFVSMNLYGNLSNCVLEAMSAGKCIVTLAPCDRTQRDEQNHLDELKNSLLLIDRENMFDSLISAVQDLIEDAEQRKVRATRVRQFAESNLTTWAERIHSEINMLHDAVN